MPAIFASVSKRISSKLTSAQTGPGSAGGGFGPELVTNGDFASAVGWTLTGGASIAGGLLSMDGSGSGTASRTAAGTITTGNYRYSFDVVATDSAGPVRANVGGALSGTDATTTGTFSGTITSAAATQNVRIQTVDTVCQVDNFSVKRIL